MPVNMVSEGTMAKAWHVIDTSPQMVWCANTKRTGVPCHRSINIRDYSETGTWIPHPSPYG